VNDVAQIKLGIEREAENGAVLDRCSERLSTRRFRRLRAAPKKRFGATHET
jgi:hypothetical protein